MKKGTGNQLRVWTLLVVLFFSLCAPMFQAAPLLYAKKNNEPNIVFNTKRVSIVKNQTYTFRIKGTRATDEVSFSSDDESIAVIVRNYTKSCKVKGIAIGKTKITANVFRNGKLLKTVKSTITVTPPAVSVRFRSDKITVAVDEDIDLMDFLNLKPKNTAEIPGFSLGDESLAFVSTEGELTGLTKGTTTITATIMSGKSDTITLEVIESSKS